MISFSIGRTAINLKILAVLILAASSVSAQPQSVFDKLKQRSPNNTSPMLAKEKPALTFDGGSGQAKIKGLYYADLTDSKREALLALAKISQKLTIQYDNAKSQTPIFIEAKSIGVKRYETSSDEKSISAAQSVMALLAPVFGINSASIGFTGKTVQQDELGKTIVRLQQTYRDIPVFGAESIVHFSDDGTTESWNGRVIPIADISTAATITNEKAAQIAYSDAQKKYKGIFKGPDEPASLGYDDVAPQLIVFAGISQLAEPKLAWRIIVRPTALSRYEYYIDAITGKTLKSFKTTCNSGPATGSGKDLHGNNQQFPTYDVSGKFYMIDASRPMFNSAQSKIPSSPIGAIITLDSRGKPLKDMYQITSDNNTFSDPASISAHHNAGITYEYYRAVHNRNAIDNKGSSLLSVIHVPDDDGTPMDNAYWNGKLMAYGDGNTKFSNLAGGLDVAAHEMTHGVTEHSAGLVYLSQSGALNESMSDVFACMVDRNNFKIGEDVVQLAIYPTGTMRDMGNPHNGGAKFGDRGWQPEKMSEYQTLPEDDSGDNGGVHVNSGIPNHAAYLIAQSLGREQTEKIYYRALTQYLTSNSQFIDLRIAVVKAAKDLYDDQAVAAAKVAFDKVEIFDGNGTPDSPDEAPVNGPHFLLVHRVGLPFTLAIVKPVPNASANDIRHISRTQCNNKPSVSDDGAIAVFVASDKTLHGITLDPNNPVETIISANPVWNSVALSRDGKRIAATPAMPDGTITVFNLENNTFQNFTLYSPTFSQGQKAGLVIGADYIEWDASGQYVLYDAMNALFTDAGEQDYADVGLINVWDKSKNTYADGQIRRVLPPLGDGENIGNPTFAKTNQGVVAFDYLNTLTNQSSVMGANIFKMKFDKIIDNPNTVGRPSFSPDDKQLAYATLENGLNVVKTIPLTPDRISPAGTPITIISAAVAPVYFAVGQRPSSVDETTNLTKDIEIMPNPASNHVTLSFNSSTHLNSAIAISDVYGHEVLSIDIPSNNMEYQTVELNTESLANGMYAVRIVSGSEIRIGRFVIAK